MTCPNCDAPIDAEMQACKQGGAAVDSVNEVVKKRAHISGCQTALMVLGLSLLAFVFIINAIINARIDSYYLGCFAKRGSDIVCAINTGNRIRYISKLPPLWPKTKIDNTNQLYGISSKVFTNSSDYFYELYDGENVGRSCHNPYVMGFDYSKLSGAGVITKAGPGKLETKNNTWIIAANITPEDDPRIPVLISRNVDVREFERIVNNGLKKSDFRKHVTFNKMFDRPLQEKGYVMICKDGSIRYSRGWFKKDMGELFGNKELPPRDPSKPPIEYLMP